MEVKKEQLIYTFIVFCMQKETRIIDMESPKDYLKFILKVYVSEAKKQETLLLSLVSCQVQLSFATSSKKSCPRYRRIKSLYKFLLPKNCNVSLSLKFN